MFIIIIIIIFYIFYSVGIRALKNFGVPLPSCFGHHELDLLSGVMLSFAVADLTVPGHRKRNVSTSVFPKIVDATDRTEIFR